MSRTIYDLPIATNAMVKEGDDWVEYFKLKSDSNGTVIVRNDCDQAKRMHSSNVATYTGCEMDEWLENSTDGFLSRFSSEMLNALVARSISTYDKGDTEPSYISRRAYLLSYGELFGSSDATEPDDATLPAFMINKNTVNANTCRIAYGNGSAVYWWLRSPYSTTGFYGVSHLGGSGGNSASNTSYWVRPALNVSNDTIVSDEGAEIIYVLPEATYREVDFTDIVGSEATRPSKAIVTYDATNLTDVAVYVSNNGGDESPVWVDATSQEEITFTNTSKETDEWKIAVRCYGRSTGVGYFKEPRVRCY